MLPSTVCTLPTGSLSLSLSLPPLSPSLSPSVPLSPSPLSLYLSHSLSPSVPLFPSPLSLPLSVPLSLSLSSVPLSLSLSLSSSESWDCRSRSDVGAADGPSTTTLLSLQRVKPCSTGLLGKRVRGQGAVATLAPSRSVNAALPVVNVYVEGKRCSALVDTGCSRSIVSADRCVTWSSQQMEIRMIDGVSWACCGVGTVSVLADGGNHAKVLVARQRPLGYDLLLGIDAIRALGGMIITPAGNVELVFSPNRNVFIAGDAGACFQAFFATIYSFIEDSRHTVLINGRIEKPGTDFSLIE
ncbi:unnamed protein product [Acanthosepion pharaonis]|uniref:Retropepsins domain-containing protein n=1 Tax=Acanthosepion pharaonis TaxID=158019 RepID=A0A812DW01_ACAPH|nr:unnamed protein product [Sepia pharaonis]